MRVTYAYVFYFSMAMMTLTASMIFCLLKPIRHFFFSTLNISKVANNGMVKAVFGLTFGLIFIILTDSIFTYRTFSQKINEHSHAHLITDNFESIEKDHSNYISVYGAYRQLYMAERNFMLCLSTLFITFVFIRFVAAFTKLDDEENAVKLEKNKGMDSIKTNNSQEKPLYSKPADWADKDPVEVSRQHSKSD